MKHRKNHAKKQRKPRKVQPHPEHGFVDQREITLTREAGRAAKSMPTAAEFRAFFFSTALPVLVFKRVSTIDDKTICKYLHGDPPMSRKVARKLQAMMDHPERWKYRAKVLEYARHWRH